jgi:hypothetical protein
MTLIRLQRNSIRAASCFVGRNHLPPRLKQQILAYMCLKFRAESLNQQQLMDQLPKSICKSICEYLFLPVVKDVYLFKGVSKEVLLCLVASHSFVFDFKQPARNFKISTTFACACNANAGH